MREYADSSALLEAAELEARRFSLPENWQEGRTTRYGLTIDASYSLDRDDAISVVPLGNNEYMLRVSISDVGSFLCSKPAIKEYAQRQAFTVYNGEIVEQPMIPAAISQDALSLVAGQPRPTLTVHIPLDAFGKIGTPSFSRDVLIAQAMSPEEVDASLINSTGASHDLAVLETIAKKLFKTRHHNIPEIEALLLDSDEEALAPFANNYSAGRFIVQECMIAANVAAATFMDTHQIPALYRVDELGREELMRLAGEYGIPDHLVLSGQPAVYKRTPGAHLRLKVAKYMHFTSPLRRLSDFVNHCNLVAFLEDNPFPYIGTELQRIEERLSKYENGEASSSKLKRLQRRQQLGKLAIANLSANIADGSAHAGDLAQVFFGQLLGTSEEIKTLKESAARFVATKPFFAKQILQIAAAQGNIEIQPTNKPYRHIIKTIDGEEHVLIADLLQRSSVKIVRFLGKLADTEVTVSPEHNTELLHSAIGRLRIYASEKRLFYRPSRSKDESTGEYTVSAHVFIKDDEHTRSATHQQRDIAEGLACLTLMNDLDLWKNPPSLPKSLEYKQNPHKNPIVILQQYTSKAYEQQPDYSFPDDHTPGTDHDCTLRVAIRGIPYETEGSGKSKTEAKQNAAEKLLLLLPPLETLSRPDPTQ